MKIHLPSSLRKALLSALAVCSVTTASAAVLHSGVSMQTYTDFGQNMGRYVAEGYENALLAYIREKEGGIYITYVDPDVNAPYRLLHGMIDFSSQNDGGYGVAIGYNFYATVEHNGVHNNTYTGNYIGSDNAIHYQTVEIRYAWNAPNDGKTFIFTPSNDHKVGRQSKIFTDITGSVVYGTDSHNWDAEIHPVDENGKSLGDPLAGQLLYRAGCGTMEIARTNGSRTWISGAYSYITGGIATISNTAWYSGDGAFSINVFMNNYTLSGINANYPLPFAIKAGDSGSPAWLWNDRTERFEYVGAAQSGDFARYSQVRGAPKYTVQTMEGLNVHVGLAATEGEGAHGAISEVHIGEVIHEGDEYSDNVGNSATTWKGHVLDGSGNRLAEFVGMKSGVNTWGDLSGIKDNEKWFNYNSNYLLPKYVDMFFTNDLVFTAGSATTSIVADADVDLGLGYIRLCKGGQERARYDIGGEHLINSAGYIIDSGVDAYITLSNPEDYMREWRAVVESGATLHIEGTGDTNALLNLGGQGTTYLNRTGGHAAYNVLANNGTTVVIKDTSQIERDFTFGFRGGVLDMNGNSLTWNNDNAASAAGFTIHALDEHAIITNRKAGTETWLVWTQGGNQKWLGSFTDTEDAALIFAYKGGADGVLTMNSIHTKLTNAYSSTIVDSGKLVLSGVNTVHGKGSIDGRSANRYLNPMDWHYADATTPVTVRNGGTFELGSHARLIGDVTVLDGSTFIMREGVQHRMEYIEGGSMMEDTDAIRAFFGLKGNISLTNGNLRIEFNEGVTAVNEYAGTISGTGTLTVNAGLSGGVQKLSGVNSMTGTRSVTGGGLVLANEGAFNTNNNATGDNAWRITSPGWLAVEGMEQTTANLLTHIHTQSDGTLAFSQNAAAALDMTGHADLFLGAQAGKSVEYGVLGTSQRLTTWHTSDAGRNQWLFGGGGGEIVVNWRLSGDSDLVLGNPHMTGTVTLANTGNNFTGNIIFTQGSNVVLNNTSLVKSGAGTQVFSGDYNVKDGRSLTVSGGQMDVNGILGVYKGTAEIAGGTLNTTRMVMVDKDDADASLTIGQDGVLNISSNADNALLVTGWSYNAHTGTLTVQDGGQLNATDAVMQVSYWDNVTGVVNVNGGLVDVKGVSFVHDQANGNNRTNRRGSLTLSGYGEMTIGEAGINGVELEGSEKKVNVSLGNGTIHASSDWKMGGSSDTATLADVTLTAEAPAEGKTAGTVIDTDGHKVAIDNNLVGDGSLVKDGEGTLELNGNSTYTGATTVKQGTLAVNAGASLNNGQVTVSAVAEQGTLKSAVVEGTSVHGLDAAHLGELDGMAVTFENVTVEMSDMVISADSVIGKPAAQTFGLVVSRGDDPAATVLDVTNTSLVLEHSALDSTETLTADQVVNSKLTMEAGSTLATLVSTNFSLDTLTGTLTLDLSAFSAEELAVDYIAVLFDGVTGLEEFTALADIPGFGAAVSVTTKDDTAYFRLKTKNPDAVPEPATATLSLLALAALAARRRRKQR